MKKLYISFFCFFFILLNFSGSLYLATETYASIVELDSTMTTNLTEKYLFDLF